LVKDITAGPVGSNPHDLIEAGGELYFLVGYELWKSDGTSENTRLVRNFDCDQCGTYSVQLMGVANDTIYIKWVTHDGVTRYDLWRYETSSGQASLVKSFTNLSTERYCYAGVGNTFYFINNTVEDPPEDRKYGLWKTDGTSAGTVLLKEWGGQWSYLPEQLTPADHFLYFVGGNNDNRELWVSNGTSGGTHQVKDLSPTYTRIYYMISLGDTLFFIKDYPSGQLWMSDGTESGTVYTGFSTNYDSRPVTLNGQLFFYGSDDNTDEYGGELYQYCPSIVHINKDGNCNGNTPCYGTINDGYKASGAGTKIRVCTGYYLEDLIFNENKEIVFSGGWKTDYSDNSGGVSTIGGSLIVTGGTVIIEGIVIDGGTTTFAKAKEQQFSCRLTESWSKMTSFQ
jgi:ELWxxDGT repeat protein